MSWVFGALAVTLGAVFLWGFIAPQGQWWALSSWALSDPRANEPAGAAYGWRRFLSGIGLLGLVIVAGSSYATSLVTQPRQGLPLGAVEQMWGDPSPRLVARVVYPLDAPPPGLVEQPLLGYQDFDDEVPSYLLLLRSFTLLGRVDIPGYIGGDVDSDTSATGSASLVVNVRGPLLCIPRQAVVLETETTVRIGVYYGVPDPPAGPGPDHEAQCPTQGVVTSSVLVPIRLSAPVGDRVVHDLNGAELRSVEVIGEP
ncbi:MAG: fumarate hydratase [Rhodoglobus sp.]